MNTVRDSSTVSTMRSRLARSDEPVSVTSTMASASCGTFTSVAPQENSTRAFTPWRARYFCVRFTTSVAITLPSRSCADCTGASSGTASTQRTGARLCLA